MINTTLIEKHFIGSNSELELLKMEASTTSMTNEERHYYEITYNEHFMFCPLILIEELPLLLKMALRVSDKVKIKFSTSFISGHDTHITTTLI